MKAYKYPIGLKSARIEIPRVGSHYIDLKKTEFYYVIQNSFTVITFKHILLRKKVPSIGDFNLLFKSILGRCDYVSTGLGGWVQKMVVFAYYQISTYVLGSGWVGQ